MKCILLFLLLLCSSQLPAQRPNILLIFTDDQGYGDLGSYGAKGFQTPHLDGLAAEGLRLTSFYTPSPVCTPSRAALLTGNYPPKTGLTKVLFPKDEKGLGSDQVTIAAVLKTAGYRTAAIGKWHLGHLPRFLPTAKGFDSYLGIPYSNDMTIASGMTFSGTCVFRERMSADSKPTPDKVPLMRDDEVIEYPVDQRTLTQRYTEEALRIIEEESDEPFFIYYAHSMPHTPLFSSERFAGKSGQGPYGDAIEEIDWSVGEVVAALKKRGLFESTLIVFTSDNGPWLSKGEHGGSAGTLRDGKFSVYEGGVRVPAIIHFPSLIPSGRESDEIAATIDLAPTFAMLAGAEWEKTDGVPLVRFLKGGASPREQIRFYKGARVAGERRGAYKRVGSEIYDLTRDPAETEDLSMSRPDLIGLFEGGGD